MRSRFLQHAERRPLAPRLAMARGVLILDENLLFLQKPLEAKNFKVYTLPRGLKDEQIAPLLAHRIFVTNNAEDFRQEAPEKEFSIIDTSGALQDPEALAKQISRLWIGLKLNTQRPFVLKLRRDGSGVLEPIE